jgi:hypothetical protein
MNNNLTLKDSLQSPTNSCDASSESPQIKATDSKIDEKSQLPTSSRMGGEDGNEDGGEEGPLNL